MFLNNSHYAESLWDSQWECRQMLQYAERVLQCRWWRLGLWQGPVVLGQPLTSLVSNFGTQGMMPLLGEPESEFFHKILCKKNYRLTELLQQMWKSYESEWTIPQDT